MHSPAGWSRLQLGLWTLPSPPPVSGSLHRNWSDSSGGFRWQSPTGSPPLAVDTRRLVKCQAATPMADGSSRQHEQPMAHSGLRTLSLSQPQILVYLPILPLEMSLCMPQTGEAKLFNRINIALDYCNRLPQVALPQRYVRHTRSDKLCIKSRVCVTFYPRQAPKLAQRPSPALEIKVQVPTCNALLKSLMKLFIFNCVWIPIYIIITY